MSREVEAIDSLAEQGEARGRRRLSSGDRSDCARFGFVSCRCLLLLPLEISSKCSRMCGSFGENYSRRKVCKRHRPLGRLSDGNGLDGWEDHVERGEEGYWWKDSVQSGWRRGDPSTKNAWSWGRGGMMCGPRVGKSSLSIVSIAMENGVIDLAN